MNFLKSLIVFCTIASGLIFACKKNSSEVPVTPISRLYVSLADTGNTVFNTLIFNNADNDTLANPYRYKSNLSDANGIIFNPYSGKVYQVSRSSGSIKTINTIADTLVSGNSFSDTTLTSARGIAFARDSNILFVANDKDSSILVYRNFSNRSGFATPNRKVKLTGRPWGIHFDKNRLFVTLDSTSKALVVINNASQIDTNTVISSIKMPISGAQRLHGIFYSNKLNLLLLTDIGLGAHANDGSLFIIENINAKLVDNTIITPNQIISGGATLLGNPVDITFDEREGKGLIYIAEKANKKILIFKLGQSGNVAPFSSKRINGLPESVYIDARDKNAIPGNQ